MKDSVLQISDLTVRLPAGADLRAHIRRAAYDDQVQRYVRALRLQLGVEAGAFYVFLNVGGQVAVVPALQQVETRAL